MPRADSRIFLIGSILVATLAHRASAQPTPLLEATKLFHEHRLSEAEALTRRLLAEPPATPSAMYLLGTILEAENQPKESLEWFTRAAALQPPRGEDLRIVAMDYVRLNSYPDALHWLTRSTELDPQNAEAWYDLARARMMQGNLQGAREPLERVQRLKPGQPKVLNNLGVVAEGENHPIEAEAFYREAVRLQSATSHPSEQPLLNLGTLLLEQNKAAEALPLLSEAVRLAPADAKCHTQLARALEQQQQRPAALEQLQLAVNLDPGNPSLHYQLGQMYRRAGVQDKANDELRKSGSLYGTRSAEGQK